MTRGGNGLSPIQSLADRQKCPTHPTKRKYADGEAAREIAEARSKSVKVPIEAYLCDGCGQYHLTRSTGGSSAILPGGKFTVGEFHNSPNHPVFSGAPEDRGPSDEESPIIPGDFDTRVRAVRAYLEEEGHGEPTTKELCEALGECSTSALRPVMAHLGYRNTRGRAARWVPAEVKSNFEVFPRSSAAELLREKRAAEGRELHEVDSIEPIEVEDTRIPLDLSYDNDAPEEREPWPYLTKPEPLALPDVSRETEWVDLNADRIRHIPVGDLLDSYAAAGITVRIQIER